jgi:hypothetical protein
MGRQIDPPSQSGSRHQNVEVTIREQLLHQVTVCPAQTSVMHTNTIYQQFLQILTVDRLFLDNSFNNQFTFRFRPQNTIELVFGKSGVFDSIGCPNCVPS